MSEFGTGKLYVHSLTDGSLVRSIGSVGNGRGQFDFSTGGLCITPNGNNVLVAESYNYRVQEVQVVDSASRPWVRFIGEHTLRLPKFVDCNNKVIVVSEGVDRITVLRWHDGSFVASFGNKTGDPDRLTCPMGVRVLGGGRGLVVVDRVSHRLCVYKAHGEFVTALALGSGGEPRLASPTDVLESAEGFIVVGFHTRTLASVSRSGEIVSVWSAPGSDSRCHPLTLAALPDGGCLVLDGGVTHVCHSLSLRRAWLSTVVLLHAFMMCGYAWHPTHPRHT